MAQPQAGGASCFDRGGSIPIPDSVVIEELDSRGTVYGTCTNDDTCRTAVNKIGADNDNKAGGCNSFRITISEFGITVSEMNESD